MFSKLSGRTFEFARNTLECINNFLIKEKKMNIIAISGSLRKNSFNSALLRAAQSVAPDGVKIEIMDINEIPLYNGDDEEANGVPPVVETIKDKIAAADGLLISTPEYNHGIPGVLKNTIDWLSRPGTDIPRVFGDKPLAIMGASPSGFGTVYSQTMWLPIIHQLKPKLYARKQILVSAAHTKIADGVLTDDDTKKMLADFIVDYIAFIKSC